ncbi:hypothetical protein KIW84_UN0896 [Lathyrus oleraceus]|nr:hypothetical protein KIW84_UN0896 [Pisum sativum]
MGTTMANLVISRGILKATMVLEDIIVYALTVAGQITLQKLVFSTMASHQIQRESDIFNISDIREDLYKLRQGTLDVSNYFTQLKVLWDELDNYCPILV